MIARIELQNFTAFDDLAIDFSPKINVIIGKNGTGKSHLLKSIYFLCKGGALVQDQPQREVRTILTQKLLRLFQPLDQELGKLWKRGSQSNTQMSAQFASGESAVLTFNYNSTLVDSENWQSLRAYNQAPVLIPTKEVLSFILGIHHSAADRATLERLFDDSYLDLCTQLVAEPSADKQERLEFDPRFGSVIPEIVDIIGGKFEFYNGKFYFRIGSYIERPARDRHRKSNRVETVFEEDKGAETSNTMIAEGFRKIGILQQVLLNGTLNPGVSGSLLWDEPEANMNPMLMRFLVQTLLELSRNGQQIILATHDYVLLKWFDLLRDKKKEDHVRFFSLYKDEGTIRIDSTDEYDLIAPNSIDEAYTALLSAELDKAMGVSVDEKSM